MSVGGLPRCVALMVVLAIDAEKCWHGCCGRMPLAAVPCCRSLRGCREQGERPVPVMPSVMAV